MPQHASVRLVVYLLFLSIIVLGLQLRLNVSKNTVIELPLRSDAGHYTAYAYNLKLHGVYSGDRTTASNLQRTPKPDAMRTPGYSLFLYPLVSLKSFSVFITKVIYTQAILGTITLVMIAYLAYILLGAPAAIFVTLLSAISPHLINMGVYILSETLFTFLLIAFLMLSVVSLKTNSLRHWLISGIVLALATLARPTLQYFIVFLVPFLWHWSPRKAKINAVTAITLAFIGVMSVWFIRNLLTIGQLSDPTLSINTLHHGMYPDFMFNGILDSYAYPYKFDPQSLNISSSISSVVSTIWERLIENPATIISWYASKPFYLFQWGTVQGYMDIFIYPATQSPYFNEDGVFPFTLKLMKTLHPILVWLSLAGMLLCLAPEKWMKLQGTKFYAMRLVALLYLYYILIHMAGAPFPRYAIPIRPITYMLAMLAIHITWHNAITYLKYRRRPTTH